jgi:flagellar basal body-associated protein FliL
MLTRSYIVVAACSAAVLGCAVSGCGSKPRFQFDRMDLLPAEEELTEFPLGEYKIPIPLIDDRNQTNSPRRNRFQFDFHLYALVSPKEESQIEDAWDCHEGVIRDQVISICRSATIEELQEPELATLKARLTDVLATQLGEKRLRQLLITDVVSQEL